jgi:hypothetical protein
MARPGRHIGERAYAAAVTKCDDLTRGWGESHYRVAPRGCRVARVGYERRDPKRSARKAVPRRATCLMRG